MEKIFIIAEAGINHNGKLELAKKMVNAAAAAGADAVKFQTFKAEKEISRFAPKAEYQKKNTGIAQSQLEMAKKLELDEDAFRQIAQHCRKRKIMFLSTPSDFDSIDFLSTLGLEIFKIPSGEITNLPHLRKIGLLKKKIILSTGMSDMAEIKNALKILMLSGTPKKNITVLHCNSEYPTPFEDVNLMAMLTIKESFKVKVGYSDHTLGIEVPIAAATLGASIIEKHFTLDKKMRGPDHRASLEPSELRAMIRAVRNIEKALGDGIKRVSLSEIKNKDIARKSILAAKEIKRGEYFSSKNITVKRPGNGINPMQWDKVVGRIAKRDFNDDELIEV